MKTTIFFFMTFLLLASCSKDNSTSVQLPPETQVGANTFGVTINGKVYVPRDPTGSGFVGSSGHGVIFWRSPDQQHSYDELEIVDGASAKGFQMIIHMLSLNSIGGGKYILHQSNFHKGIDSTPFTNLHFEIWDSEINNYAYYGSIENQGELNITRYDFTNRIVSGNFKGKFVRYDNPNEFITITDGRFDINGFTLPNAVFP